MVDQPRGIKDLLKQAIQEFLSSTGLEAFDEVSVETKVDSSQKRLSSVLDFNGAKIKGALIVVSPLESLAATNPRRGQVKSFMESDHRDWVGETANQIVGSLKRLTAGYNVDFSLGTPTVMPGNALSIFSGANNQYIELRYGIANHVVHFYLNTSAEQDVCFEGKPTVTAPQAAGGDAFLF